MLKLNVSLLICTFFLFGCSSIPTNKSEDVNKRAEIAKSYFDGSFHVFYIPSDGMIADTTFISLSKTSGPSSMAKELASLMSKGDVQKIQVLVSGPNNTKTAVIIKNAVKLNSQKKLPELELMYLGSRSNKKELENLITSLGSKFHFDEY